MKQFNYLKFLLASIFCALCINTAAAYNVNDSIIAAEVLAKITYDKSLSVFKINVEVNDGIVDLAGEVDSSTDVEAAVEIAQSVKNVEDVKAEKLHVRDSSQPTTDVLITAKVKGRFILNGLITSVWIIHVETNNGIVYLSGTVSDSACADKAISIAKQVRGVKCVKSRIKIQ